MVVVVFGVIRVLLFCYHWLRIVISAQSYIESFIRFVAWLLLRMAFLPRHAVVLFLFSFSVRHQLCGSLSSSHPSFLISRNVKRRCCPANSSIVTSSSFAGSLPSNHALIVLIDTPFMFVS